jgi:spermidine/putrescine transport system permease protein
MVRPRSLFNFSLLAWSALAFLYAPIAIVLLFSFNSSPLITVWESFSLHWYQAAFANEDLHRATLNSLLVGSTAAVTATLLALLAALAIHQQPVSVRIRNTVYGLMTLPMLIPEVVIAVATLAFFSLAQLDFGLGNVYCAHVAFCLPFAYSPIQARLNALPPSLSDAARDLYAPPWQEFALVTLPQLWPGIFSGLMLAFITSLDDFLITQLIAPPGAMTLPVFIYSMVRRGITPEINAVSAALLLVSMLLGGFSFVLKDRKVGE